MTFPTQLSTIFFLTLRSEYLLVPISLVVANCVWGMSQATLGFFRATHAHTHQNPYLYTRVWVLTGMGHGLSITHRYQNLYGFKTQVHCTI